MAEPRMMQRISDVRKQIQDAVVVCEHKEGSKLVHQKDVPTIIRGVGFNPSEEQLAQVISLIRAQLDEDNSLVPYSVFETVVVPWLMQNERALARPDFHMLMRAFKAFDAEGKGWIDAQLLKTTLAAKGDALSADEAIKLMAACSDSKGRVWYQNYAMELQ